MEMKAHLTTTSKRLIKISKRILIQNNKSKQHSKKLKEKEMNLNNKLLMLPMKEIDLNSKRSRRKETKPSMILEVLKKKKNLNITTWKHSSTLGRRREMLLLLRMMTKTSMKCKLRSLLLRQNLMPLGRDLRRQLEISKLRRLPRKQETWNKPRMKHLPNSKRDQLKESHNSMNSTVHSRAPRKLSKETWILLKKSKKDLIMIQTIQKSKKSWKEPEMRQKP